MTCLSIEDATIQHKLNRVPKKNKHDVFRLLLLLLTLTLGEPYTPMLRTSSLRIVIHENSLSWVRTRVKVHPACVILYVVDTCRTLPFCHFIHWCILEVKGYISRHRVSATSPSAFGALRPALWRRRSSNQAYPRFKLQDSIGTPHSPHRTVHQRN